MEQDILKKLKLELDLVVIEQNIELKEKNINLIIGSVNKINNIYLEDVCKFIICCFENEDYIKSVKTVINYLKDMVTFFCWFQKDMNEFNSDNSKKYRLYLRDTYRYKYKPICIKTINYKIISVNQYFKFLDEVLQRGICTRIKLYKQESQMLISNVISVNDIKRMIKQAARSNDIRAVAIMYMLYFTGARVSEVLQIKVSDLNNSSFMATLKGKRREVLLIPKLKVILVKYKELREVQDDVLFTAQKDDFLFTGRRGPIGRATVDKILKEYCGKARGISKGKAHAHGFRHRFTLEIGKLGANDSVIAQLLGHRFRSVTGIYLQEDRDGLIKLVSRLSVENE